MEQLTNQNPRSYSLYFVLKIWFRARNVIGTFEKRAPGLVTEFRPGIAFTICTNHLTTFSDVPFFPEIFCWNDPESLVPFTLRLDFPETFVNGKQSKKEQDEKCILFKNQLVGANW